MDKLFVREVLIVKERKNNVEKCVVKVAGVWIVVVVILMGLMKSLFKFINRM